MSATPLRTERALVDYLTAADWGEGVTAPRALTSYDLGQETSQDDAVQNRMPAFPYIVVRVTGSELIHPLAATQEMTVTLDIYVSADDVNPEALATLVGTFDGFIQPLFDAGGEALLTVGEDNANGPFTAQFIFPGDLGGSSVEGRARVFNRIITIIGSATT